MQVHDHEDTCKFDNGTPLFAFSDLSRITYHGRLPVPVFIFQGGEGHDEGKQQASSENGPEEVGNRVCLAERLSITGAFHSVDYVCIVATGFIDAEGDEGDNDQRI